MKIEIPLRKIKCAVDAAWAIAFQMHESGENYADGLFLLAETISDARQAIAKTMDLEPKRNAFPKATDTKPETAACPA